MILNFRRFVEGGKGSGTKMSVTGLGAGGQAQAGMGMTKPAQPQVTPVSEFSPRDTVPAGFKPGTSPGSGNYVAPAAKAKSGLSGAGVIPPKISSGTLKGGAFGGGSPGSKMKSKMKAKMKK